MIRKSLMESIYIDFLSPTQPSYFQILKIYYQEFHTITAIILVKSVTLWREKNVLEVNVTVRNINPLINIAL